MRSPQSRHVGVWPPPSQAGLPPRRWRVPTSSPAGLEPQQGRSLGSDRLDVQAEFGNRLHRSTVSLLNASAQLLTRGEGISRRALFRGQAGTTRADPEPITRARMARTGGADAKARLRI